MRRHQTARHMALVWRLRMRHALAANDLGYARYCCQRIRAWRRHGFNTGGKA